MGDELRSDPRGCGEKHRPTSRQMKAQQPQSQPDSLGDMNADDFRRYGHQVVDWITDYLSHPARYSVLSQNQPGDVKAALPTAAPERGETMEAMLADLDRVIIPG